MKPIKISILVALFLGITFTLIPFSFARIFVPNELDVNFAIQRGDELLRSGELSRAWKFYKNWLTEKENIDHIVFETEPGIYQNAQTVILKKMAKILEMPDVPSEVKLDNDIFFKNFQLPTFLDSREEARQAMIEKARLYLPSKDGFKIFDQLGSVYLENGDCEKALSLWEEAKNISLGYKNISKKDKMTFSEKLGFCYKQLGWNDQLKALFEENPELSELEGEEVVAGFERITALLKNLNTHAQTCPITSEVSSLNEDFQITRKEKIINNEEYSQDELCLTGRVHWCFEKDEHSFLSKPLILNNALHIVARNRHGDLILLTLDKKTGSLLNKQYIATKTSYDWLESTDTFYPYKLFLKDGNIQLTTEVSHHKFNLDGSIALTIDLTRPEVAQDIQNKYRYFETLDSAVKRELFSMILAESNENHLVVVKKVVVVKKEGSQAERLVIAMGETSVPPLLEIFEKLPQKRDIVSRLLTSVGSPAVSHLLPYLSSEDEEIRNQIVSILRAIKDPKSLPKIKEQFEKEKKLSTRLYFFNAINAIQGTENNYLDLENLEELRTLAKKDYYELAALSPEQRFEASLWLIKNSPHVGLRQRALLDIKHIERRDKTEVINNPQNKIKWEELLSERLSQEQDPNTKAYIMMFLPPHKKYEDRILEIISNRREQDPSDLVARGLEWLGRTHSESFMPLVKQYLNDPDPIFQEIAYTSVVLTHADGTKTPWLTKEKVEEIALGIFKRNDLKNTGLRSSAILDLPNNAQGKTTLRNVYNSDDNLKMDAAGMLLKYGEADESLVSFVFQACEKKPVAFDVVGSGLNKNTLPVYEKVLSEIQFHPVGTFKVFRDVRQEIQGMIDAYKRQKQDH